MSIRSALLALAALAIVAPPMGGAGAQPTPWVEPVSAPVVDGYRPPAHVGASGNRGWEYTTEPGTVVVAAGAGVIVFAGPIGDSNYISIQHADGRRTTYSHVASIGVEVGDAVAAGSPLGTAGDRLHFGVRVGADYQDPAQLFAGAPPSGPGAPAVSDGSLRLVPAGGQSASMQRRAEAPATWFGQWLDTRQPSIGAASPGSVAQGWSGAATDTLAGGPQHTAEGP